MARFTQGFYKPNYPDKYIGDVTKIRYMSSWELSVHSFFDNNVNILKWSSEGIAIPYIKPTDGRTHKYYPDYYIEYVNKLGVLQKEIIEVKPEKQTKFSRAKSAKNKLYEDVQFAINVAKWNACQQFCNQYGITFRIVTEKTLWGDKKPKAKLSSKPKVRKLNKTN